MNLLNKTRCYLIGPIENAQDAGAGWRNKVKGDLKDLGIIFLDPLIKPFYNSFDEDNNFRNKLIELRNSGNYEELGKLMKQIRQEDLSLVDRMDFGIFYYVKSEMAAGSWEEFFWGNRLKRPIYIVAPEGVNTIPYWVFGCIGAEYLLDSFDKLYYTLREINDGRQIDYSRWRLFKENYR